MTRVQSRHFFRNRNQRRERMLRKMANMRAAKERKRLARGLREEPKMVKWHRFEFGVRDKVTGRAGYGEAWTDLVSIRDVVRRLRVILKECNV